MTTPADGPYFYIYTFFSPGEFVAQFKFTVLLMANGPLRITNSLFDPDLYKSEHEVEDPELKVSGMLIWILGGRNRMEAVLRGLHGLMTSCIFSSHEGFAAELCQPQGPEEEEKEGETLTVL